MSLLRKVYVGQNLAIFTIFGDFYLSAISWSHWPHADVLTAQVEIWNDDDELQLQTSTESSFKFSDENCEEDRPLWKQICKF